MLFWPKIDDTIVTKCTTGPSLSSNYALLPQSNPPSIPVLLGVPLVGVGFRGNIHAEHVRRHLLHLHARGVRQYPQVLDDGLFDAVEVRPRVLVLYPHTDVGVEGEVRGEVLKVFCKGVQRGSMLKWVIRPHLWNWLGPEVVSICPKYCTLQGTETETISKNIMLCYVCMTFGLS